VRIVRGHLQEFAVEKGRLCLLNPESVADASFDRILEVAVQRSEINPKGQTKLKLGVALWHGGLPVDVLPAEGFLEVNLGEEIPPGHPKTTPDSRNLSRSLHHACAGPLLLLRIADATTPQFGPLASFLSP
jgi:hypothetical protein